MELTLTPNAKQFLAAEGYDPVYGARPLKRTLQKRLLDQLALKLLNGEIRDGDHLVADVRGRQAGRPQGGGAAGGVSAASDAAVFPRAGAPGPARGSRRETDPRREVEANDDRRGTRTRRGTRRRTRWACSARRPPNTKIAGSAPSPNSRIIAGGSTASARRRSAGRTARSCARCCRSSTMLARALANIPPEFAGHMWVAGARLVERKLRAIMARQGLTPSAAVGRPFDPALHEAIRGTGTQVERECRRGYRLNGCTLRPTLVIVGDALAALDEPAA
jgi:hypothetical protein